MRFDGAGSFLAGQTDVDPQTNPDTILAGHFLVPKSHAVKNPAALHLVLIGTGSETLTVSLYYLVEDKGLDAKSSDYIATGVRWIPFVTGEVITNNVQTIITSDLPAGGIIYARRTADTIAGGQTRKLLFAWS